MTDNPLLDTIQEGTTTYDLKSRVVKNQNSNTGAATNVKVWLGTLQQYNNISPKDTSTLYGVTDGAINQTKIIFRRYT